MRFASFFAIFCGVQGCVGTDQPIELPGLAGLSAGEGTVLELRRAGELSDPTLTFQGMDGLTILSEPNAESLVMRLPHGQTETALLVGRGTRTRTYPISLRPIVWQEVATWDRGEGPLGREYFSSWQSRDGSALYVYGGFLYEPQQFTPNQELWRFTYEAARWEQLTSPTFAALGARVARGTDGLSMYFGGAVQEADGSITTPRESRLIDDTGADVVFSDTAAPTVGAYTGGLVFDSLRNRFVSFCGADSSRGMHCMVNAYTEASGWTRVTTRGDRPQGRNGFHYAYDVHNDRIVLYGGDEGSQDWADGILADAFVLNFDDDGQTAEWVPLVPSGDQPPRRNGAFAYDPNHNRLFVWGGTPDGENSSPGLDVLSLDAGHEAWSHIDVVAPSRTSGQGVYDESRNRILWGFGNGDDVYTDLWSMSLPQ